MKNMKKKVLGIFLAAVMVISGLTFASDYIYAVGSEEAIAPLSNFDDLLNKKPKECAVGEKKNCYDSKTDIYYNNNGDALPATLSTNQMGNKFYEAHDPGKYNLSDTELKSYIRRIHENMVPEDYYKTLYDHYVVILPTYGSNWDAITYVRCDKAMGLDFTPGVENFNVTYKVYKSEEYIGTEIVEKGKSPTQVPQTLPDEEWFEGKEISYWVDENGEQIKDFSSITIESDRVFYAVLKDIEKEKYSVNYDSNQTLTDNNNRIETDLETPAESGTEIILDDGKEIFSNIKEINGTNVIFIGWTPDRTNKIILKNDSAPETMLTANSKYIIGNTDKTFYAVWAADENENGTPDYKEGTITITKKIAKLTNIEGQGKPTFIFKLESSDKSYIDYKIVTFDVDEQSLDGYYSKTVSFTGLPAGNYKITELDGIRYDLMKINGKDVNSVDSVQIVLSEKENETVEFENKLNYENNISDTGALTNTFTLDKNNNVIYTTKEVD